MFTLQGPLGTLTYRGGEISGSQFAMNAVMAEAGSTIPAYLSNEPVAQPGRMLDGPLACYAVFLRVLGPKAKLVDGEAPRIPGGTDEPGIIE